MSLSAATQRCTITTRWRALSLLLATIGVYAVLAYFVSQRRREIGIRIALGADMAGVRRLVIGQGLLLTSCGLAVGTVGAWLLTRFMLTLLHGVRPTDPTTFIGSIVLLTVVATLASYAPARRAARIDPLLSLRS